MRIHFSASIFCASDFILGPFLVLDVEAVQGLEAVYVVKVNGKEIILSYVSDEILMKLLHLQKIILRMTEDVSTLFTPFPLTVPHSTSLHLFLTLLFIA